MKKLITNRNLIIGNFSIVSFFIFIWLINFYKLDFISWSFGNDNDSRNSFFNQLAKTPAIAFPFVYVGPSLLFLGLSLHTLNFIKSNLIGSILTFSGAIFMGLGYLLWSNLMYTAIGVTIFALGLIIVVYKMDKKQITLQSNVVNNYEKNI